MTPQKKSFITSLNQCKRSPNYVELFSSLKGHLTQLLDPAIPGVFKMHQILYKLSGPVDLHVQLYSCILHFNGTVLRDFCEN